MTPTLMMRSTHASTSANQSVQRGSQSTSIQDVGAHSMTGSNGDGYNMLLSLLQSGQFMARNGLVNGQNSILSGVRLPSSDSLLNNLPADNSVHSYDEVSSDSLCAMLGVQEVTAALHTRRLRWYGHVARSSSCINSITSMTIPSARRGRPKKTWSE